MHLLERQETLLFLLVILKVKNQDDAFEIQENFEPKILMHLMNPWILCILLHVILLLKGYLYGFVTPFKMLINMLLLEEPLEKTRNHAGSKNICSHDVNFCYVLCLREIYFNSLISQNINIQLSNHINMIVKCR